MPEYLYVSKDLSGKTYKGTLETDSISSFYRMMGERGHFCVSVKQAGAARKSIEITPQKIKLKDLSVFCRQFSTMLSSGLTVIKCLDVLYQQSTNKFIKTTILSVYEAVQKGDSLSKAMKMQKKAFPTLFLSMVAAGELSGSLDNVMKRMADQYEKDSKLQNKLGMALIYPAILSVMTVLVVIFMLTFILPRFMVMFNQYGGVIPTPTRILLSMSHFLTTYWYVVLIIVAVVGFLIFVWLRSESGKLTWDKIKLKSPVFGKLLLIVVSSRFSRTLASLFSSGMPIVQALEIVGSVLGNKFMEKQIQNVSNDVRRGVSLSSAVRRINIFPPMLCSMLSIGEESGNLDDILTKTSAFYDEESDTAIQKMVSLIEPIMIVVLAFIIGFIIISIILPIYSIYNSVGAS